MEGSESHMDCRKFKELLDSYLCQELAVETNHTMLSHAEHCAHCRCELASRRNLRTALRRACEQDRMSDEACERLRALLRAEAGCTQTDTAKNLLTQNLNDWRQRLRSFFALPFAKPILATAMILVIAAGTFTVYRLQSGSIQTTYTEALALSDSLITESVGDHLKCAPHFVPATQPAAMSDEVRLFDEACVALDKIAATGAQGLQLHAAHVCRQGDRQFAHLVYTQDKNLISLLVTTRDERALKSGKLPLMDSALAGMQEALQQGQSLGAYQTPKHVVLVVSDLSKSENERLARTLAMPVVEHLRKFDSQSANNLSNHQSWEVIARVREGEWK